MIKFSAHVIEQHIEEALSKQEVYSHTNHLGLSRASVLNIVKEFYINGGCPEQFFDDNGVELDEYIDDEIELELNKESV